MNQIVSLLGPELWQLAVVGVLLVQGLARPREGWSAPPRLGWLPLAALAGVAVAAGSLGQTGELFGAAYRVDGLSQFFKLAVAIGFAITA